MEQNINLLTLVLSRIGIEKNYLLSLYASEYTLYTSVLFELLK